MACTLKDTSISAVHDYKDTLTYLYQADLGQIVDDPLIALVMAQSMGPKPVPVRRQKHPTGFLFANNIEGKRTSEHREVWDFTVTWGPLPPGEDEEQQNENPLLRPAIYDIQYIEEEYVVKKARNVERLGAEFAAGGPNRPAGTLGNITNGAGIRPDEPIVRVRRKGLITIDKNFANLGEIMDINENFAETCNSDSVVIGSKTFVLRRLKFEVATSQGKQIENGYTFYPGRIEISINKTTDIVLDNVGYHYYSPGGLLKRFKDSDGEDTAEPDNLNYDGTSRSGSEPVQIGYRDLEEVPYATFFE